MSNTIVEDYASFPELEKLKRELFSLRHALPLINGRSGELTYSGAKQLIVGPTANETVEQISILPFKTDDTIFNLFAQWFIHRAFAYAGEGGPDNIHAFCGVIGESGQYLDYLHSDPMLFRITSTVVDLSCMVNPSTVTAHQTSDEAATFEGVHEVDIPFDIFMPQIPESGIVAFVRGQYHSEKTLPKGVAKLSMSATYNSLDI